MSLQHCSCVLCNVSIILYVQYLQVFFSLKVQ